jgi:serine/threonine protein kinase
LRSENIFLTNDNIIKLGELGSSKRQKECPENFSYISPEVLKGEAYASKAEIWSIGIILYELCALKTPFESKGISEMKGKLIDPKTKIWFLPGHFSKRMMNLASSCLIYDPEERVSVTCILKMFYNGGGGPVKSENDE